MKDIAKFKQNGVVIYQNRAQSKKNKGTNHTLTRGNYNGKLSEKSKKNISQYLNIWLSGLLFIIEDCKKILLHPDKADILQEWDILAPEYDIKEDIFTMYEHLLIKPSFITLTLSSEQIHDDKFIKRHMLNRFIQTCKRKYNVIFYYFYAEKQKNGNLHFHLIFDRYIDWQMLRNDWNDVQSDNGYITAYQKKMQDKYANGFFVDETLLKFADETKQRERYEAGKATNWTNPNSTDIKAVGDTHTVAQYITKYSSKDEKRGKKGKTGSEGEAKPNQSEKAQKTKVSGRLWGCSDELRGFKYWQTEDTQAQAKINEYLEKHADTFTIEGDFFKFISYRTWESVKGISDEVFAEIRANIVEQVTHAYRLRGVDIYEAMLLRFLQMAYNTAAEGK